MVWTTAGALLGLINTGRYVGVGVFVYSCKEVSCVAALFSSGQRLLESTAIYDLLHIRTFAVCSQQQPIFNMALLRTLTTKIKTKMSPSSSPTTSPTSPPVSSFERISGRKDFSVQRPETQTRIDSFIEDDDVCETPKETEKKNRRVSRFREELFE